MTAHLAIAVDLPLADFPRGETESLRRARVRSAKAGFTTRRVQLRDAKSLVRGLRPRSGDLVLARVSHIGHQRRIEAPSGRRRELYCGDEIIVTYGARYAPDQFEAVIPRDLRPCHLVAAGGLAGEVVTQHPRVRKATRIEPVGLLGDANGRVLNLRQYAIEEPAVCDSRPTAIAVVGTSMNSGKTTTMAALVHGLAAAGLKVGVAKLTGTGSGGDLWSALDAGAATAIDFTDAGYPSTQGLPLEKLEKAASRLLRHLAAEAHDILVLEIADGLLQLETAELLRSDTLRERVDAIIFAAVDAMGALAGARWLIERNLPLIGLSGLVAASPLARQEAVEATGLPVFGLEELADPQFAPRLCLSEDAGVAAALAQCVR